MKRKSIFSLRITWIVVFLFFLTHVYVSWGLPSEGENSLMAFSILIIAPLLVFILSLCGFLFKKFRNVYTNGLIFLAIGMWMIIFSHGFFEKQIKQHIWPWTEINAEIDKRCANYEECDYANGKFEYTFPLIFQTIKIEIWEGDDGKPYIDIDYSRGRYASFSRDFEFIYVD